MEMSFWIRFCPHSSLEMRLRSVKFANGACETSRFDFWEMVVSQVETIEEALAKVHIGSE